MKAILFLISFTLSSFAFESFEYVDKNYKITSEEELSKNYSSTISPYFYNKKINYFMSFDNLKIAYKIFTVKDAKANIVISSGRTEGMLKYQELIYDLNRNGYSVYILDHRGQGYSQRLLSDSQVGHVGKFIDYVNDMHKFVTTYVDKDRKMILIGHSMGGAIASLYVEKYTHDFDGVVLSSPMHQPALLGESFTGAVCDIFELRKRDLDRYIVGEKSYDESSHIFTDNLLTHSKERYEISKKAYAKEPATKIGGPSVRWVKEACLASARSVENASQIQIPLLLLQAGDDKIVNKEPQALFCENSKDYCQAYTIKGAYHELFVEKHILRKRVLTAVFKFIAKIK